MYTWQVMLVRTLPGLISSSTVGTLRGRRCDDAAARRHMRLDGGLGRMKMENCN